MERKIQSNFCCGIVICHGKCEIVFLDYLKRNTHASIRKESNRNGNSSIQILGLKNVFENSIYSSKRSLLNNYTDIKDDLSDFKIFTFMDFDDMELTDKDKKEYISGSMFKKYWLHDFIIPIWSNPNLDMVLYNSKLIDVIPNNREKVKVYNRFFSGINNSANIDKIKEIRKVLSKNKDTNLEVLIDYMIKYQHLIEQ